MTPLLLIEDLRLEFHSMRGVARVLEGVNLRVERGEVLGLVGESGCGKTVTGLAVLGLLPRAQARIAGGRVLLSGEDLLSRGDAAMERVRGARVSMIFQDPSTALNPVFTVGEQLSAVIRRHRRLTRAAVRARAGELLELVGLPPGDVLWKSYPHQLSGGQKQRVCIALALAPQPDLMIADEPTTSLDVTIQAQILRLLLDLRDRLGIGVVLITHDVGVAAQTCDRMAVMYAGRVVEEGPVARVLKQPQHPYTIGLLSALARADRKATALQAIPGSVPSLFAPPPGCRFHPRCPRAQPECRLQAPEPAVAGPGHLAACYYPGPAAVVPLPAAAPAFPSAAAAPAPDDAAGPDAPPMAATGAVVEVRDLRVYFPTGSGRSGHWIRAVDGVSFDVGPGESVALVGESGCGKTTTARAILGLRPVTGGQVRFLGREPWALPPAEQRRFRRYLQIVFQDPYGSLDPRVPVADAVAEPLRAQGAGEAAVAGRVAELLERVGLAKEHYWRRPHELSGGQCQRVAIARALTLHPRLLVLDEPTSALDVSVQARTLLLLKELQADYGLSYLFITHDLGVVRTVADRVVIMYMGRVVESGPVGAVFTEPLHPYTLALMASVPSPDPDRRYEKFPLEGGVPDPAAPPTGCRFHPRCPYRRPECLDIDPDLVEAGPGRSVACHLIAAGEAAGVAGHEKEN